VSIMNLVEKMNLKKGHMAALAKHNLESWWILLPVSVYMGLEKKEAGAGENGVVALSVNWWEKNISKIFSGTFRLEVHTVSKFENDTK
jgi:hypothetical protein